MAIPAIGKHMGALLGSSQRGRDHFASRRHHRTSDGEEGFTLIELLIVLVILPLVVGAIAMVLITTLKNDQTIQGTVTDSSAATLSSSYYVRDIESASSVTTNPSAASPAPCSAGSLSGASLLLGLQLEGTQPTEVSYYSWTPPSGGPPQLVREFCPNGSSTPQSDEILSDNISSTNPLTQAAVSCITPTPQNIPTGVTCPATNWTPTYLVSNVTLNVTLNAAQGCSGVGGACAPNQFTLTGDPQSGVPIPPINQPCGVLTLLGTGTDINFSAFSANQTVSAQGPILLNSGYNANNRSAIVSGIFTGNNNVTAQSLSSCPGVSPADAIGIYNCAGTSSMGQSTNFHACPTSGSNSTENPSSGPNDPLSVSPSPVQISLGANATAIPDPLLSWASQSMVTPLTPQNSQVGACTGTNPMNCSAGRYANGLNISANSRTVNFAPGNYQFGTNAGCQSSLCIAGNGDVVNFGSGHYTFTDGLNVSGSLDDLCGGEVPTSSCPNAPQGGVFFYVSGGATDLGNSLFATTIQLGANTNQTDEYHNVLLWQDGNDPNNQVVLSSGISATNNLAGEIYAPTAQIVLNGWGANVTTQDIVANTLQFGSNLNLTLTITPVP